MKALHEIELRVEVHPTIVPRPIGIAIYDKTANRTIATLSAEHVRSALAKFDALVAAANIHRPK